MTNATTQQPAPKGFSGLHCPLCGNAEAVQQLHLDDCHTVTCAECSEDYDLDTVRDMLKAWQRVLDWVALAPAAE